MAIERRIWRLALAFACLGVLTLALLPTDRLPTGVFDVWDKAQHALAFALLGLVALRGFPHRARAVFLGLAVFGGLIEAAQWAVGWRSAEWADWAADAVGLACVLGASVLGRRIRHG